MENFNLELIEKVLKKGIRKIEANELKVKCQGFISLSYMPQLNDYIFTYGLSQATAGYVLLSEYKKTWEIDE